MDKEQVELVHPLNRGHKVWFSFRRHQRSTCVSRCHRGKKTAMIFDLAEHDTDVRIATDVLIVGAGIAGLLLAHKLRAQGLPVVVLESGGKEQVEQLHPLNKVVVVRTEYRGATEGRARCLGGTSTRWGGALIPFLAEDLDARPHLRLPSWPVALKELAPYIPELETLFGVDHGSYDESFVHATRSARQVPTGDAAFLPRFAKWPVFRKRNIATLFKQEIENDPDWSIWLNATVTGFQFDNGPGRLSALEARHSSGRRVKVSAKHVVLCAGAIESTRLLLLLDRQSEGRIFQDCTALGRGFYDHVSIHAANIVSGAPWALNRLAGFRFVGTTMRSLRFELAPSTQAAERVGSAFGHISFQPQGDTGFDALRLFMKSLQRTGRIDVRAGMRVVRDFPYLASAGYWRYAHHQLKWPQPARYELHIVVEQTPRFANRIFLSDELDSYQVPRAAIDWCVQEPEFATLRAFARHFEDYWTRRGFERIGRLEWLQGARGGEVSFPASIGDVFHPGGTTRIGMNRKEAVVDRDLKTFAISNLWVASTSVFPSGASANPTMMLMLFTLRLADKLGFLLRRQEDSKMRSASSSTHLARLGSRTNAPTSIGRLTG